MILQSVPQSLTKLRLGVKTFTNFTANFSAELHERISLAHMPIVGSFASGDLLVAGLSASVYTSIYVGFKAPDAIG